MFSAKNLTERLVNVRGAEDVMHSTGYARVKTTDANAVQANGVKSFVARKSIDEQRKYVRGYKNARIVNEFYGIRRAQASVLRPRATEGDQANGTMTRRDNRGALLQNGDKKTTCENPIDTAVKRAQFSASAPRGLRKR